jgi:CelD/BcsL family acetyltransferase involved in cellulose biosynthesis
MRTVLAGPELDAAQHTGISRLAVKPDLPRRASTKPCMRAVEVRGFQALAEHRASWDDLSRAAIEPNAFYESWMLLPALETFGEGRDLRFVLIFAEDKTDAAAPEVLCGLFPLEQKRAFKGLSIKTLTLWRHLHCFLSTPLVRAGMERECLAAFFEWLGLAHDGSALMEFGWINTDGPFYELLADYLNETGKASFIADRFTRALYRPASDADSYLSAAISKEHRRDLRRRHKRLSEQGRVEFVALQQSTDAEEWIENFLKLEASGWKGQEGSAFSSNANGQTFFINAMIEAFNQGRLMMIGIELDGRPIALKCNLIAAPGSFAFKIAFDEDYARFSPGVLLEMENIRLLHQRPDVEWMDSCAEPDHFMMNRVWTERRTIIDLVVSTGKRSGNLAVSSFPLLRWVSRNFVRPCISGFFALLESIG